MKRSIYGEEHEAFRSMIREFITREVTPHFGRWEEQHLVDRDLFRKLGKLGVMGFGIPEEYGGPGDTQYRYQAIITEETARQAVHFGHYTVTTGIVLPY